MTFFLEDQASTMAPRGPDMAPTTLLQGLGAATSQMMRDTDASFQREREVRRETFDTAVPIARRVGIDALNERYQRDGAGWDHIRTAPTTVDEFFSELGIQEAAEIAMSIARERAINDPGSWADMDLTDEGIEARVTKKRVAEDADETAILNMMPNGRASAEFIGGMAGMLADVRQVPFLALGGGGGSLLRILGRGAMLNVAAEAVTLPSRFSTAKELGKPDPSVLQSLGVAAAGGAAFEAAAAGIGRAFTYLRGRSRNPSVPGLSRLATDALITATEDAISRGDNPLEAMAQAYASLPVEPPPSRPPLVEPKTPVEQEAFFAQREAAIADAEAAFAQDFPEMLQKYPLARVIQKLGGIKAKRMNPATGVMEPTFAASELASMGVTQRTHPFMFRKTGHSDLDNIVASEHPGLNETISFDPQTGYFDRDALIGALGRELSSGQAHRMSGEIIARLDEIEAIRASDFRGPADDFIEKRVAEDGFFVNLDVYHMFPDGYQMLASHFDDWAKDKGFDSILTRRERQEILDELYDRGGDAEYLVERTLEREMDHVDGSEASAPDRAQAASREGFDEIPFPGEESVSRAGVGRGGSAFESEAINAGQQSLIPGVRPVTQRDRLEARQNAPMRGLSKPADDGLFDLGARQQMDMFSDPASKEARSIQESVAADFRDQIKKDGDFAVDIGDGKGERMASSVLDDLDLGDMFSARLDLCGKGPKA